METTACDLCGSESATAAITSQDFLLQRREVTAEFVKCDRCGLVYQNPRPTQEEMHNHYPSDYESYTLHPEDSGSSWLLRKAIQYGLSKRRRLVSQNKGSGRILDVGCATGVFLREMHQDSHWDAYGVEPNGYAARIARERYGLNVFHGTLEQASFENRYFDVVTLWDVLEHLHSPSEALAEIHRILKADGLLILRVPNGLSRDAQLFGKAWAGLDPPRHLYVFTPDTLRELLTENHYSIRELGCQSGGYPTFVLSLRFWLTSTGSNKRLTSILTKLLYHPVMRLMTSPLFYARGLALRGPLITAVTTKHGD